MVAVSFVLENYYYGEHQAKFQLSESLNRPAGNNFIYLT